MLRQIILRANDSKPCLSSVKRCALYPVQLLGTYTSIKRVIHMKEHVKRVTIYMKEYGLFERIKHDVDLSKHFTAAIIMVLQNESVALCNSPGEQAAVETLLSMGNSVCISSGDESSMMSEDESRFTPSPTSSIQSSDEDSLSSTAEPPIFRKNSKLAKVSFTII